MTTGERIEEEWDMYPKGRCLAELIDTELEKNAQRAAKSAAHAVYDYTTRHDEYDAPSFGEWIADVSRIIRDIILRP